ncbi:YybH family protein [Hymenobacter jejuensis]|uniref:Nuclear transport factor 2 family protein n=1 Tax=Hymenobacter jejuensis TaxID=2502781 RepID=A0A5B7ZZL6_9BACT|nr:nuclear transport factor 2 family protein [Hymenobacter jejuensis]QDA59302.1 nuclear transport factor 2 family protein [Hymenobacter jejuensis]
MKSLTGLLLATALLVSCSDKKDDVNVQDLNQQFISAWNNKDADKLTALLADDAQFLQGETHFKGKSEVTDKWVKATLGTITDLKTNVVSSDVDSHLAYEAGTFSVDVMPSAPDQPHGIGEGNFILLWKKGADGAWKLSYAQLEDLPVQVKNQ